MRLQESIWAVCNHHPAKVSRHQCPGIQLPSTCLETPACSDPVSFKNTDHNANPGEHQPIHVSWESYATMVAVPHWQQNLFLHDGLLPLQLHGDTAHLHWRLWNLLQWCACVVKIRYWKNTKPTRTVSNHRQPSEVERHDIDLDIKISSCWFPHLMASMTIPTESSAICWWGPEVQSCCGKQQMLTFMTYGDIL